MSNKFFSGIKSGSTDVTIPVILRDSTTGALKTGVVYTNVTCYYWLQGSALVQVTTASGASLTAAHADGAWFEASSSLLPGTYRLDVPDAAFAATGDFVFISVTGSGIEPFLVQYALSPFSLDSSGRVTVISAATGAITNASFAAGAIDATAIASNAIAAAKIASGAITNAKFAAGAIDATAIAADAIAAAKIASGAITNAKFATDAIDANAIAASGAAEIATALTTISLGTESYAADGAVPALNQMLFMIWSILKGHTTTWVTLTAYKLDDTSTAMTFTFAPNSATPTQITRTS